MIVGLMIRHFKVFKSANFIKLVDNNCNSSVLIGKNAVGKSSVLEALDVYFNQRDWNKSHGTKNNEAFICPIFILKRNDVNNFIKSKNWTNSNKESDIIGILEGVNSHCREISEDFDKNNTVQSYRSFYKFFSTLSNGYSNNEYYIIAAPKFYIDNESEDIGGLQEQPDLISFLRSYYSYIYLPAEMVTTDILNLRNNDFQKLMNKDVLDGIEKKLSSKSIVDDENKKISTLDYLNSTLEEYLTTINQELESSVEEYRFTPKKNYANRITEKHLREVIVDKFLSLRTLKKNTTEIQHLSSGEQRVALIQVISAFLNSPNSESTSKIIIAIDEPENSLHTSSTYEHFMSVMEMSKKAQLLVATHWYGYLPLLESESLITISQSNTNLDQRVVNTYSGSDFFASKANRRPENSDISIKSYYDLANAIIASMRSGVNWIICEGLTDKMYIDYYIKELKEKNKIRVIALGGCGNVVKLYKHLYLPISDLDFEESYGKVLCLTDSDSSPNMPPLEYYDDFFAWKNKKVNALSIKKLSMKLEDDQKPILEGYKTATSTIVEIEDCLNPNKLYKSIKAVLTRIEDHAEIISKLEFNHERTLSNSKVNDELNSIFNKNELSRSEKSFINQLFNEKDQINGLRIKELVAKEYTNSSEMQEEVPTIINEILEVLNLEKLSTVTESSNSIKEFKYTKDLSPKDNLVSFIKYLDERGFEVPRKYMNHRAHNYIYNSEPIDKKGKSFKNPYKFEVSNTTYFCDESYLQQYQLEQFINHYPTQNLS